MVEMSSVNIICVKWGTRYGPEYVNRLFGGVTRFLSRPFRFVCVTDDPTGLHPKVESVPFPEDPGIKRGWPDVLVKLMLLEDGFAGLSGPSLFLDLDVLITESIDCFFEYKPGKNCIIHNWVGGMRALMKQRPAVGNSSIFRFEAGSSGYVYDTFMAERHRAEERSIFNTEQAFLTYAMREVEWWPEAWVCSFKRHCRPSFPFNLFREPRLPEGCRILVFHGRPDPDEALVGYRGKKLHHRTLPARWMKDYWEFEG